MVLNNINLQKPLEKLFIRTSNETYAIEGRVVKCWVEAYLCARYKSGETDLLSYTVGIGKAVCSPEDKFDANVGLRLASARAEANYCARFSKLLNKAMDVADNYARSIRCLIEDCDYQVHHNERYIADLIEDK